MPRRRYVDEDTTDAFLNKPDLAYEAGDMDAALRAVGLEPGDEAALDAYLAERGWSVPPLPPPVPK